MENTERSRIVPCKRTWARPEICCFWAKLATSVARQRRGVCQKNALGTSAPVQWRGLVRDGASGLDVSAARQGLEAADTGECREDRLFV